VWIDLVKPTATRPRGGAAGRHRGADPGGHCREIEISSRLYVENGARYMTATLMCGRRDTDNPRTTAGDLHPRPPPFGDGALRRTKPLFHWLDLNKLARSAARPRHQPGRDGAD